VRGKRPDGPRCASIELNVRDELRSHILNRPQPNVPVKLRRIVFVFSLLAAAPAAAQEPLATHSSTPEFFPRYDFRLAAAALWGADERFSWDTYWGGDIDVFDYVVGRTSTILDYEAVLGSEFRAFDVTQGNYVLEVSSSYRFGKTELAGIFHHVSRHLSDRPKPFAIAWNILGARVLRQTTMGPATVDFFADAGWATQYAHVDYKWVANADVVVRRPLSPRVEVFARGTGHLIGVRVNPELAVRGTQAGGNVEGGVRLAGAAGVAELFAGYERRIDADPLDFTAQRWFTLGFRLLRR
jgi:hypothetical protein